MLFFVKIRSDTKNLVHPDMEKRLLMRSHKIFYLSLFNLHMYGFHFKKYLRYVLDLNSVYMCKEHLVSSPFLSNWLADFILFGE